MRNKKISILFSLMVLLIKLASAQILNPVKWSFTAKKTAPKTYELHMIANLDTNWHIYAQDFEGPAATSFSFAANPLVKLDGIVKESGKLKKEYDPVLRSMLRYYNRQVDFIQKINMRTKATTAVQGKVMFVTCNDITRQCLLQKDISFSIKIDGK
ncbi:MAG: hypothetical protein ABI741_01405 [Ferruginibacter sp.]